MWCKHWKIREEWLVRSSLAFCIQVALDTSLAKNCAFLMKWNLTFFVTVGGKSLMMKGWKPKVILILNLWVPQESTKKLNSTSGVFEFLFYIATHSGSSPPETHWQLLKRYDGTCVAILELPSVIIHQLMERRIFISRVVL